MKSVLRKTLDRIKRKGPPFSYEGRRKNLVWVQPTLIAEIEYRAWTHDGKVRHASYKGLRDVQDNAVVIEINKADGSLGASSPLCLWNKSAIHFLRGS
ncbi:ATP dependent DNA ligase C terminal region [Rhizobium tibeticum]|uniref:DNA ligase (ATP) n=1 Tax=Rhizobium tibeticum TaxID=501024 RepID=A0A1H8MJ11_9HYPH|nr:ATP-dependent DNA ligase [Rhizobium tibeticum]SEO17198.1 ATP dependent DNA ligase C terminal region [Rhizobium tibeticum]